MGWEAEGFAGISRFRSNRRFFGSKISAGLGPPTGDTASLFNGYRAAATSVYADEKIRE